MDKVSIEKISYDFIKDSGLNIIDEDKALDESMIGLEIFDNPLIGYASAENKYLNNLKNNTELNIDQESPTFWLPEAKTVISFFLPFKERIRKSNIDGVKPSNEWLHARIDGQNMINHLLKYMRDKIVQMGYKTVIPMFDDRFIAKMGRTVSEKDFGSNWSERHVAYAAGLGTFSLSKGMITEKGIAGRFGSLVTEAVFESDTPSYKEYDENCIMCGRCIKRCPQSAISFEHGKIHKPCSDYLDDILDEHPPYYGCGKCQVGVPCEDRNPRVK